MSTKLMSECKSDLERIKVWKGLLSENSISVRNILSYINEDKDLEWVVGDDPTRLYLTLPHFQRSYNAEPKFKTALIESLLVGVPIGSIKMHSYFIGDIETHGIVDGQHRIKTINDFVKNRFKLDKKHLSFLKTAGGQYYKDLEPEFKRALMESTLTIEKSNEQFIDKKDLIEEFSKHCFIRMNENINPMSPYVLSRAKCVNPLSTWLDRYLNEIFRNESMQRAFIISDRNHPDAHKNDMVTVLEILYGGLKQKFNSQKDIVESHFDFLSKHGTEQNQKKYITHAENHLMRFSNFIEILHIKKGIEYPFSNNLIKIDPNINSKRLTTGNLIRFTIGYREMEISNLNIYDDTVIDSFLEIYTQISNDDSIVGDNSLKYKYLENFQKNFRRLMNN